MGCVLQAEGPGEPGLPQREVGSAPEGPRAEGQGPELAFQVQCGHLTHRLAAVDAGWPLGCSSAEGGVGGGPWTAALGWAALGEKVPGGYYGTFCPRTTAGGGAGPCDRCG